MNRRYQLPTTVGTPSSHRATPGVEKPVVKLWCATWRPANLCGSGRNERKKESLGGFFENELSARQRRGIEAACVDMWEP